MRLIGAGLEPADLADRRSRCWTGLARRVAEREGVRRARSPWAVPVGWWRPNAANAIWPASI